MRNGFWKAELLRSMLIGRRLSSVVERSGRHGSSAVFFISFHSFGCPLILARAFQAVLFFPIIVLSDLSKNYPRLFQVFLYLLWRCFPWFAQQLAKHKEGPSGVRSLRITRRIPHTAEGADHEKNASIAADHSILDATGGRPQFGIVVGIRGHCVRSPMQSARCWRRLCHESRIASWANCAERFATNRELLHGRRGGTGGPQGANAGDFFHLSRDRRRCRSADYFRAGFRPRCFLCFQNNIFVLGFYNDSPRLFHALFTFCGDGVAGIAG
jgi:hypothetical protein